MEGKGRNRGPLASVPSNLKILTSAVKNEMRTRATENWAQKWATCTTNRTTHKINKKPSKDVLQKFRQMSRPESSVIIQARTGKIGLRDYLYKINSASSPECSCGYRRQTVHHTLLECPGFNELREEMWAGAGKRETNLTRLLGTPTLAAKASKVLLATGELMQFRHLNVTQVTENTGEALEDDGW